jgi:hypothetical protein
MKFSFSKIGAYVSIIKRLPAIVVELQGLVKGLKNGIDVEDIALIESTVAALEGLVADIAAALK